MNRLRITHLVFSLLVFTSVFNCAQGDGPNSNAPKSKKAIWTVRCLCALGALGAGCICYKSISNSKIPQASPSTPLSPITESQTSLSLPIITHSATTNSGSSLFTSLVPNPFAVLKPVVKPLTYATVGMVAGGMYVFRSRLYSAGSYVKDAILVPSRVREIEKITSDMQEEQKKQGRVLTDTAAGVKRVEEGLGEQSTELARQGQVLAETAAGVGRLEAGQKALQHAASEQRGVLARLQGGYESLDRQVREGFTQQKQANEAQQKQIMGINTFVAAQLQTLQSQQKNLLEGAVQQVQNTSDELAVRIAANHSLVTHELETIKRTMLTKDDLIGMEARILQGMKAIPQATVHVAVQAVNASRNTAGSSTRGRSKSPLRAIASSGNRSRSVSPTPRDNQAAVVVEEVD